MAAPNFTFTSDAYTGNPFTVVDFQGTEAISSLFRFDIGLKCPTGTAIDVEALLAAGAKLTLQQEQHANTYRGMLASVEQQQQAGGHNYYRVVLVPPAWLLSRNTTTAAYVNQTHPAIVKRVLSNAAQAAGGLTVDAAAMAGSYPTYDFTCQYAETDWDFVCRLMEYEGVYFYFHLPDSNNTCIMVVQDSMAHSLPNPGCEVIPFTDPSSTNNHECIVQITRQLARTSDAVTISGYNYQQTTLSLQKSAPVTVGAAAANAKKGSGQTKGNPPPGASYPATWIFDNRAQEPDPTQRLAMVRAQEEACWADIYSGSGAVSALRAGYTFSLSEHPVAAFNQSYLVTGVRHSARNLDQQWATSSYTAAQAATSGAYYSNSFTAIPADVQFRPQRITPKPRISGVLSAAVWLMPDAASSLLPTLLQLLPAQVNAVPLFQVSNSTQDQNAYQPPAPPMDEQGRYLVTLPFANGAVAGSSYVSAWIRMSQPAAGQWTGVQYMLEPGAEVLLAFVNGDPDLPVIVGSVYNGGLLAPLTAAQIDPQV
ncbi:MAG TPA: type VI secretion system tip protein TssI/VgrG [Gammaproteobacteria bacterium]|nr:type VI secretion system tip protein TssI/VgrG [Gammaproteobacteria bacterium]